MNVSAQREQAQGKCQIEEKRRKFTEKAEIHCKNSLVFALHFGKTANFFADGVFA